MSEGKEKDDKPFLGEIEEDEKFIPNELRDDTGPDTAPGPHREYGTGELRRTPSSGFRSAELEPEFTRESLDIMRDRRRQWAVQTLRPIKEFAQKQVKEGRKRIPTAREVLRQAESMPEKLKKASHQLSEVELRQIAKQAAQDARRSVPRELRKTEELDDNTLAKALLTCCIGVLTGLAATFVQFAGVAVLYNPKMDLVRGLLYEDNVFQGFIVHFIISTIMSVLAAVLVVFVAPSATGAGFAEIKVSANGALYAKNTDDPKVLTVKILGLSLVVGSGLAGARDFVHIGGLVASNVSNFWEVREKQLGRKSFIFKSNKNRLMFLASGVASAGGAAFRSPVGGVIWAFEEFAGFWSQETMGRCVMAALCATTTAWYFVPSQGKVSDEMTLRGTYDFTVIRMEPLAHGQDTSINVRLWELPIFVLIGIFGGTQGGAFVMISGAWLAPLRKRVFAFENGKYYRLVEIAIVTLIASAACVLMPLFWPCRPMSELEIFAKANNPHVHFRRFTCPEGQMNEMASLTFPAGFSVINNFFVSSTEIMISPWTLFVYAGVYYILTILAVGCTAPTGPFVHLILVGGAWGRCIGEILRINVDPTVDVRLYSFMGIVATFCGFKRMALTLAAFFCELGASISVSAPLMLCSVATRMMGDRLTPSMTQFMCEFNNYPFLPDRGTYQQFRWFTAHDIMVEMRGGRVELPMVVGENDTLEGAEEVLEVDHDSYPVVANREQGDMRVVGLVRRAALARMVEAAAKNRDRRVNVGRVMEVCPWYVMESTPANRVFKTFIKQGLRQLLVFKDGTHHINGIITRHDLHVCLNKWPPHPEREYLAHQRAAARAT